MAPWKLPVIVAAIAVPIVGAFALGGGGAGVAVGALAAVALVVVAARQRPRGPIGSASVGDGPRQVLLVVTCAVEEPASVRQIAAAAGLEGDRDDAGVLVLSPAKLGFLDRWASDVEGARVVQAVEDQLQSFTASEVVLVSGEGEGEVDNSAAAAELESRLRAEFRHVVLSGG